MCMDYFEVRPKDYFDMMFFVVNNSYITAQKSVNYDTILRKIQKSSKDIKNIIAVYAYLRVLKHTILELPRSIKNTKDIQDKYQICLSSMKKLGNYFNYLSPDFKQGIDAFSDYLLFPAMKKERGKNFYKSMLQDFDYFKKSKVVKKHFIPLILNSVLKDYERNNLHYSKEFISLDVFIITHIVYLEVKLNQDILNRAFNKIDKITDFFVYYTNYENCLDDITQQHTYTAQALNSEILRVTI